MADSIITDKMRAAIGVESVPVTQEIEKGAIIRFAQAIGDPNPLFVMSEDKQSNGSPTKRPPGRVGMEGSSRRQPS